MVDRRPLPTSSGATPVRAASRARSRSRESWRCRVQATAHALPRRIPPDADRPKGSAGCGRAGGQVETARRKRPTDPPGASHPGRRRGVRPRPAQCPSVSYTVTATVSGTVPASESRLSTSSKRSRAASGPPDSARAAAGSNATPTATRVRTAVMRSKLCRTSCSTRAAAAACVDPNRQSSTTVPETAAINASARPDTSRRRGLTRAPRSLAFRGEDTEAAEYRKGYNRLVRCHTRLP